MIQTKRRRVVGIMTLKKEINEVSRQKSRDNGGQKGFGTSEILTNLLPLD